MLFWISVGLFATATSIGFITFNRDKNLQSLKDPETQSNQDRFQIDDQILFQNQHWFIKKLASATDGIKELQIAVLEPSPSLWIRLKDKKKVLINGFYKENLDLGKDRVLPQHFFLNDSSYDFRMKTRMKCNPKEKAFWENESSIEIDIYEDKIQKNYLIQIKGSQIHYVFEGDNYAADEMMILSKD